MRRSLFFGVLLVTVAAGLFARGQRAIQNQPSPSPPPPPPSVLNMWYWDDLVSSDYRILAREFEQANPGNKLELSVIPWDDYWTKLQSALAAGAGPDVFWLNQPNAESYISAGQVMDLEKWAAAIGFSNFNDRFCKPYMYQGRHYAVPFMWDSIVLFYNKAAFDQAGIAYPNETWTWDDYYGAARRLTIKNGDTVSRYGVLVSGSMQSGAGPFIYQNGAGVYNSDGTRMILNTPQTREAIQLQLNMINDGYAPPDQVVSGSSAVDLFTSGLVAMLPMISNELSFCAKALGQDLRVAPLPREQRQATIYHNIAYAAAANTKQTEATGKLMAFAASRRAAEIVSKTFTPCYNGMADLYFNDYQWAGAHYIPESIDYGFPLPIANKNAAVLWNLTEDEMNKIYAKAGRLGVQLADLENLVNAELDASK